MMTLRDRLTARSRARTFTGLQTAQDTAAALGEGAVVVGKPPSAIETRRHEMTYYIEFVPATRTYKVMCWNRGRPVVVQRGLTQAQAEACVAQR
jgi:hypothetical protein